MKSKFQKNTLIGSLFFCLLLGVICPFYVQKALANHSNKRVLFISSYSYAWETVPEQIKGIQSVLSPEVLLDYKFMDTKNCSSKKYMKLFYQSMKTYLSHVPAYDAIIVGDDDAFQFALKYQDSLFPNIPIAFEGVNDIELAQSASQNPYISGVIESLSYENVIRLATDLYPEATTLTAILDDTVTGQSERKKYYQYKNQFPKLSFEEINTSQLTQKEIEEKLESLNDTTILLYIMCSENADHHKYIGTEGIELVTQTAPIPTFSIVSIGLGYGFLGGEIVSQKQMGAIAAQMVQDYFNGTDFSDIALQTNAPKTFAFDENVMNWFEISHSKLPEDSEFINHQNTFWEQNKEMVQITFAIVLIFFFFLLVLLVDNIRRRNLNIKLEKARLSLQHAATYDSLTNLPNRGVFMERLEEKMESRKKFFVILFDIDHFKIINDTLGHNNGDLVLQEFASRVQAQCDYCFQTYRLGGDEFTALVDDSDPETAYQYAVKIQQAFSKPFLLEGNPYRIHSSIGIACFPKDGRNVAELVAAADDAMYVAKNNGRDTIVLYHPTNASIKPK